MADRSPRERALELIADARDLADASAARDSVGMDVAAKALMDQAEACDRDARRIAEASGDTELAALWDGQ